MDVVRVLEAKRVEVQLGKDTVRVAIRLHVVRGPACRQTVASSV